MHRNSIGESCNKCLKCCPICSAGSTWLQERTYIVSFVGELLPEEEEQDNGYFTHTADRVLCILEFPKPHKPVSLLMCIGYAFAHAISILAVIQQRMQNTVELGKAKETKNRKAYGSFYSSI